MNIFFRSTTSQQNETCANDTIVQRRVHTNGHCPNSTPTSNTSHIQWRHSDSHYGFRTSSINYGNSHAISHVYPHVHHQHLPPATSSHQIHPLTPLGLTNNITNCATSQQRRYMLPFSGAQVVDSSSSGNQEYFSAFCNANLPRYMWGPPPPYSQPTSSENVNNDDPEVSQLSASAQPEINENNLASNDTETLSGVSPSITSPNMVVASDRSSCQNSIVQEPNLTRTTKSGILLSPTDNRKGIELVSPKSAQGSPIISLLTTGSGVIRNACNGLSKNNNSYDDSVHSAMHIYEKTTDKTALPNADVKCMINENNCNSLPLRRMKKRLDLVLCRSEANLCKPALNEEENLVKEVRQKLNELGLYKYQRSKAARELAEIRQALSNLQNPLKEQTIQKRSYLDFPKPSIQMQSLPLPPIPQNSSSNSMNGLNQVYQAPSIVSSACSTNENKYETIGKSINPYKIVPQEDTKKDEVAFTSTTSASDSSYGFIASSVSPMSIQTNKSSITSSGGGEESGSSDASRRHSPFSTAHVDTAPSQNGEVEGQHNEKNQQYKAYNGFKKKESSHYAQISPLRGHGVPLLSSNGLSSNDNSPQTSYFRVSL